MRRSRRFGVAAAILAAMLLAAPAFAEEDRLANYDSLDAGHPVRIAAYVLHPVGVMLDTLIFKPAYWLGSHEPLKTLFGVTD